MFLFSGRSRFYHAKMSATLTYKHPSFSLGYTFNQEAINKWNLAANKIELICRRWDNERAQLALAKEKSCFLSAAEIYERLEKQARRKQAQRLLAELDPVRYARRK